LSTRREGKINTHPQRTERKKNSNHVRCTPRNENFLKKKKVTS
jgi:hypothetical protein